MTRVGSRKSAVCVAAGGVLLCALALLWPEPDEKRPVALAVGVWPGMETLTLARERGDLAEKDVNFVELSWTSATMMAFENGVVDGAVVSLDEMLRLKAGGHAIKAVLVMGASAGGDAIVVRKGIRSLQDLQGKRVGVELRACGEYFLTRVLHSSGMSAADVVIVPLNLAEAENAFDQHEVDAVVTMDPGRSRLVAKGGRILADTQADPLELCRVLVVREEFLQERRAALGALVKAHFQALPVLHSGKKRGGMDAVLRRERLTSRQFSECLARMKQFSEEANLKLLSPGEAGLEPVLQEMAEFMMQTGLLEDEARWQDLLDPAIVKGIR